MSQQRAGAVVVVDRDGLRGTIEQAALNNNHGQVLVYLDNGQQALVPVDELLLQSDGSFALPFSLSSAAHNPANTRDEERTRVSSTQRAGRTGGASQSGGSSGRGERGGSDGEQVVVPVVAEQLNVQKRKVERGGVRIRKVVHEREEIVDEPLMREEVQVKRVPVNRVVDGPIPVRHVGNTMIVSLLEEVLVVEKRLMLKEELHITKGEVETYRPQRVVLRTEEAHVERVGDETPNARVEDSDFENPLK